MTLSLLDYPGGLYQPGKMQKSLERLVTRFFYGGPLSFVAPHQAIIYDGGYHHHTPVR